MNSFNASYFDEFIAKLNLHLRKCLGWKSSAVVRYSLDLTIQSKNCPLTDFVNEMKRLAAKQGVRLLKKTNWPPSPANSASLVRGESAAA